MSTSSLVGTIIAGGQSARMGTDKAEIRVRGKPMLEHAVHLLTPLCSRCVVAGRPRPEWWPADLDAVTFLPDILPEGIIAGADSIGPVAGVFSALTALNSPILVLPVDMPAVPRSLLAALIQRHLRNRTAPLIMARWPDSHGHTQFEPLLAIYAPAVLPLLVEKIKLGERSLWSLAQLPRALFWNVPPEQVPLLVNLNDPAALKAYLEANP